MAGDRNDARMDRRRIYSWAMYDWANSAWSTILITVMVSYLQDDVFPGNVGILVYGWGIGFTMFLSAILLPILGAVADAHANKRHWLIGTALGGSACLVGPGPCTDAVHLVDRHAVSHDLPVF